MKNRLSEECDAKLNDRRLETSAPISSFEEPVVIDKN